MVICPVTLVHRAASPDGDQYSCVTVTASWHRQNKTQVSDTGLKAAQLVKCRVPVTGLDGAALAALAALTPGDRIAKGEIQSIDATGFAALARSADGAVILDVHDNLRGACPHYYIEGSG